MTDSAPQDARSRTRQVMAVVLALVFVGLLGTQVYELSYLAQQNPPLDRMDAYSEADALRSGEGYAVEGFTKHAGLPDLAFGEQFSGVGSAHLADEDGRMIYLHYPPGPNYIAGALTLLFGSGQLTLFRLAPITLGLLATAFLAWALSRAFGLERATIVVAACAITPMYSRGMHNLHFHGYSQSLMVIELALLSLMFMPQARPRAWHWLSLAGIGFVQGWMSFDICFIVTFAPVPLALWRGGRRPLTRGMLAVLVLGGCFTLAHLLHFLQVVAYLGSWLAAIDDFRGSASNRSGDVMGTRLTRTAVLKQYLAYLIHHPDHFYWWFRIAGAGTLFLVLTGRGQLLLKPPMWTLAWRGSTSGGLLAMVAALVISSLWVVIMINHAYLHRFFVPRHYFLCYFTFLYLAADACRLLPGRLDMLAPNDEQGRVGEIPQ